MKKLKCPVCGSNQLSYYEKREQKYKLDDDLNFEGPVSDYPDGTGDIYQTYQVECDDCNASSTENKELQKVVDVIIDKYDRLNS